MSIMDKLSPRQREVTELLIQGCRHREIAERLVLSPNTVRNYVKAARDRAGCVTTIELAVKCLAEKEEPK